MNTPMPGSRGGQGHQLSGGVTVESGQYPGLRHALGSPAALKAWLDRHRVDLVVLREAYAPYDSRIGRASGHWQPDLVAKYADLSLNNLTTAQLERVGFRLEQRQQGVRIYLRTRAAPR